jgi:hypothetical protein
MGPALGIASSEISGKVTTMRERFTELNGKLASGALAASGTTEPAATLQFIVLEEVRSGALQLQLQCRCSAATHV